MKWDMEMEEVEAILERIWDLHDKLSDAIHSISRSHFLNSIKTLKKFDKPKHQQQQLNDDENNRNNSSSGFVFVKDFGTYDEAIHEAKSLNAIRTALENLEDQLEFFHTVQIQQRAERDAAIARLEQSRIILAVRLAEHHGKKYKVIEEALAFVGDVGDAHHLSFENLCASQDIAYGKTSASHSQGNSNMMFKALISSFNSVKRFLRLDHMTGVIGNAALVAITMMALLQFNQVANKEHPLEYGSRIQNRTNLHKTLPLETHLEDSNNRLDVLLARG